MATIPINFKQGIYTDTKFTPNTAESIIKNAEKGTLYLGIVNNTYKAHLLYNNGNGQVLDIVPRLLQQVNGGTGKSTWNPNRLVWVDAGGVLADTEHYASSTSIAVNSTAVPSENFYVNGTAKINGLLTLRNSSTANLTKGTLVPLLKAEYLNSNSTYYSNPIIQAVRTGNDQNTHNSTYLFGSPNGSLILRAGETRGIEYADMADTEGIFLVTDGSIDTFVRCDESAASGGYYIPIKGPSITSTGVNFFDSNSDYYKNANTSWKNGTTAIDGNFTLSLGNNKASGEAGNSKGILTLYSSSSGSVSITPGTASTSNYTLYLPGSSGQFVFHTNDTAIGDTNSPVYIAATGKATAVTTIALDHGGTGKNSWTANRLVWVNSDNALTGANHYVSSEKIAIKSTSEPDFNLYVNGSVGIRTDLTMSGSIYYGNGSYDSKSMIRFSEGEQGAGISIGGGGSVVIGSGESSNALINALSITSGTESTYIAADTNIFFYTKCNTIGNRQGVILNTSKTFYPDTDNTGNLGGTSYNWSGVHARALTSNNTLYINAGSSNSIIFRKGTTEQGRFDNGGTFLSTGPIQANGNYKYYNGGNVRSILHLKDGNSNGCGVALTGGGLTIVGAGESAYQLLDATSDAGTETLYLTSDNSIVFLSDYDGSKHIIKFSKNYPAFQMVYNDTDYNIIRNHNNGNVTMNACGGDLFLGYSTTSNIQLYGRIIGRSSYNYGTSLPDANLSTGRIFFLI